MACCILHNMILKDNPHEDAGDEDDEPDWQGDANLENDYYDVANENRREKMISSYF